MSKITNPSKNSRTSSISLSIVTEGTIVKGTLDTKSDIRIAGIMQGDVTISGKLVLTSTGRIDGEVRAEEADLAGTVNGNVTTSGRTSLREQAHITGNITSKILMIDEGAVFHGECHMSRDVQDASKE